jgi:uncharacterized membrane protein
MPAFDLVKTAHIFSVCMMVGATLCNGLLHSIVARQNTPRSAVVTLSNIMSVNRVIMAPSFAGIVASGLAMVFQVGYAFGNAWLLISILLTAVLIAGFLGGYVIEGRLEQLAVDANLRGEKNLPNQYWRMTRKAMPIGAGAALASVVVIYLMVAKPA